MPIDNNNIQATIASGFDTAPIKAVPISGTASWHTSQPGILRVTGYNYAQINLLKKQDGLLIANKLYYISNLPRLKAENNPVTIQIGLSPERVPAGNFTAQAMKWAKGIQHAGYPQTWSLDSSDYKVDGITQATPLTFNNQNLVLVQATTAVVISSGARSKGAAAVGGGAADFLGLNLSVVPVVASRDFLATDKGKILSLGEDVVMTMPLVPVFSNGDAFGIIAQQDGSTFNLENGGDPIAPLAINDVLTQQGEIVLVNPINGGAKLSVIGSGVIDDDGTLKTIQKYLYDNQGAGGGAIESDTWDNWDAKRALGTLTPDTEIIVTDGSVYMNMSTGYHPSVKLKTNHTGDGFEIEGASEFTICDYENGGSDISANPNYAGIQAVTGTAPNYNLSQWRPTQFIGKAYYSGLAGDGFQQYDTVTTAFGTGHVIFSGTDAGGDYFFFYKNVGNADYTALETLDNGRGTTATVDSNTPPLSATGAGLISFYNNRMFQQLSNVISNTNNPSNNYYSALIDMTAVIGQQDMRVDTTVISDHSIVTREYTVEVVSTTTVQVPLATTGEGEAQSIGDILTADNAATGTVLGMSDTLHNVILVEVTGGDWTTAVTFTNNNTGVTVYNIGQPPSAIDTYSWGDGTGNSGLLFAGGLVITLVGTSNGLVDAEIFFTGGSGHTIGDVWVVSIERAYKELLRSGVNQGYAKLPVSVLYYFENQDFHRAVSDGLDIVSIDGTNNIASFPWGLPVSATVSGITNNLNVYNFFGAMGINISGVGNVVTLSDNQGGGQIEVHGYQNTINCARNLGTMKVTMNENGATLTGSDNAGNVAIVMNKDSSVSIDNNTGYIEGTYHDSSFINHVDNAGEIYRATYYPNFQGQFSFNAGIIHDANRWGYVGSSFVIPNVSYANRELGQFDSSFNATVDVTTDTIDFTGNDYQFCSIFALTCPDPTKTVDTIIRSKLFNARLYPEVGLILTLDGVAGDVAVAGNIVLSTPTVVLDGTYRDAIELSFEYDDVVTERIVLQRWRGL